MVLVTLTPWETEWVTTVGMRRHHNNLHKQDAAHYDPRLMQDNLTASIASAKCELAVAKALGRYWSGSVWDSGQHEQYKHEPDVAPNIEVRRTRREKGSLPVRQRDVADGRVLVLTYNDEYLKCVQVLGWIDADTGWSIGEPAHYSPDTTRLVSPYSLRNIQEITAWTPSPTPN